MWGMLAAGGGGGGCNWQLAAGFWCCTNENMKTALEICSRRCRENNIYMAITAIIQFIIIFIVIKDF